MSVKESVCFRGILIPSALLTVIGIAFLCSMDTQIWFKQANLPMFRQENLQQQKKECRTDVCRTLPKHALEQIDRYMMFTDFTDFLSLVNISTSVVTIRNDKSDVRIGDDVIVDIDLYNGRGERATRGGDMLRVWLREPTRHASVSGYVIDHDNGSYTGVVKAMWAGNPELMFSIANTKEHIGIFMNIVQKYGLIRFLRAGFIKGKLTESTLCSVIPNIPNVTEYCNFTSQNFNMSFFCGKPKQMNCGDWTVYERASRYSCNTKHTSFFRNYKYFSKSLGMLTVSTGSGTTGESDILCRDVSSTITWQTTNPTGFFYDGKWRSLICKPALSWTYDSYAKCLKNRPVLMTGDSTTRNWYVPLAALLKLRIFVGRHEIKDKAWHKFAEAENKGKSLSMYWSPHEIPFYSWEQNKNNFRSVASRIDDLPGNKSAIIILHWYGHLTRTTPKQYRDHVTSAKHAVVRHLKRSPHSNIFIKGPHSFTYNYFLEPFDYISRVYRQILYEEFKDLQDKVYFIDQWDATVGMENLDIHPKASLNPIMANFVFSFICD
ncbi:NXPE family member 3-like [Pecten maximus]|uniref:NXPE family member 3-like n=1 Tax=Pecten maximus TaxID=6579 RepID=UPI0014590237|nr:NXPE family member 3-like [Pecten maximus]